MDQDTINRFSRSAAILGITLSPSDVASILRHAKLRLESGVTAGGAAAAHLEQHARLSAGEAIQGER